MEIEKKPNVLMVHNYYQIPGGEDTVVANEKKMLEDHGHKVIMYTRHNSELKEFSKLRKLILPITTVFNLRTYKEIIKIIRDEKIDVVHVHNTLNLISPSVYYAARFCKVPVVQTVHNFRLLCPGATFYRDGHICEDCVENGLHCAVKYSCYRGSKAQTLACVITTKIHRMLGIYNKIYYICLTEFTKNKMSRKIDANRIFVKPNFVYDQGESREVEDYYLFVGRVEEIKGIRLLLDAFEKMPDKKLKIVGRGDLDEEIAERIVSGHINNVEMLGFQTREKVNSLMRHAKALIMCSQWYETFGMVIAEAYSNGTPAIVGRIGNIQDLVKDGETGCLFEYNSSDSLMDTVERFEKMNRNTIGSAAYQYFHNNLTDAANYQILYSIYQKLQ